VGLKKVSGAVTAINRSLLWARKEGVTGGRVLLLEEKVVEESEALKAVK